MNFSKILEQCSSYYYMLALIISFNAFGMQVATQFTEQEQAQMIIDMSDEGLKISNGKSDCFVKKHWIDPQIRNMSNEQLQSFIEHNNYIAIKKMSNGEWIARAFVRGNGGGLLGAQAGFWGGKAIVNFVGHGAIYLVALSTGPAFPVTLTALELTFAGPIEAASNVAGIGTGILVATATGPV